MRSDSIFQAEKKVLNRYQLCLTVSKVARRLHINFTDPKDTINLAFTNIAASSLMPAPAPVGPTLP